MKTGDDYKRQIMNDLAQGNVESLGDDAQATTDYENFDDFAQRSSREERRQLFGQSFHPDRISASEMEPELQKAIAQIKPNERNDVARDFLAQLKKRGLSDRDLERQLGLSSHDPKHMTTQDVSQLATFAYHSHPDIFRDVLADQPGIVKFFSHPLVAAAVGIVAARWLANRKA